MPPPEVVLGADPHLWALAQGRLSGPLARAAREVGRLEATLAALTPTDAAGACERLALAEVEAMLWAQGMVLPREEIGREMLDARAASDPEALRLARWAVRRLAGQGRSGDLAAFLGLHRHRDPVAGLDDLRPQGAEFDAAAAEFLAAVAGLAPLEPLARGPALLVLWRMTGLSAPGQVVEPAVWSARAMAVGAEVLPFVPMGRHGRRVWSGLGLPEARLAAHLVALAAGAAEARAGVLRLQAWSVRARDATTGIKGCNAARVIAVLVARPLVSAAEVEARAGVSRPTAERMLARLATLGLVREVTGHRRFRLWAALP